MSGGADFEFVEDVTSDLSLVARRETLSAVFGAAAAALLAATVEESDSLRFLNDLVYLRDAKQLLLRRRALRVEQRGSEARLVAELVGERLDRTRHQLASEVKAATAHGLSITRTEGGFRATVTLDV